jgi:hypothetical protein
MPVNLKAIPDPAAQPAPPVWWVWLLLLVAGLLAGTAYSIVINSGITEINSEAFWETAFWVPVMLWCTLLFLRIVWYRGQQALAEVKDEERDRILQQETRRGRRCLKVLGISLHSALRQPDDSEGKMQWNALQENIQALKTQPSWQSDAGIRHSRLARTGNEMPEALLSRAISHTLEELSPVLASVPADTPLALLIESNSSVPESQLQAIWQQSWQASHIRQSVTRIEGSGLAAIDHWLDHRINDASLLLVIAWQVAPEQPEGTAEAVVGLLLGHAQRSAGLTPLASLHRPEQTHQASAEDLHYALKQSLDWVPIPADAVTQGWLAGVKAVWHEPIAAGLQKLSIPAALGRDLHDLGTTLGYAGPATPWLAIACAAKGCSHGKPQLIVSGDEEAASPLWATMVMPTENRSPLT